MKSSIRSKLFLVVYGIILAFIAGLILLNNSFLENYYIKNREKALINAFYELKDIDLTDENFQYSLQDIENDYNIDIQILQQTDEFDENFIWSGFDEAPDVFERIYGNRFSIPSGILGRIIYDYDSDQLEVEDSYARKVNLYVDESYSAYVMDIQSEFNLNDEDTDMVGLWVANEQVDGHDIFYILTITFQSVHDSIKIFNSFTIIVGFFFMILSFIAMYFISYSFTNPILQINKIAQEIADLNFSNKVSLTSEDEFEDLGNSINRMSSQLETNILELQKSNDKLAKEILHKTDVDKMRRDFIASASHELKTPLSLIMGYAEALKLPDLEAEDKEDYLSIILDETNKMNNLVMELLKLSQLETGNQEFAYKEFNIKDLLVDTKKLFNLVFKDEHISCEINTEDINISSDYTQLQTVLTNFINNAIHHINGKKKIILSATKAANNSTRISVFNTGDNIPESEINHVWDSFYKLDKARTRAYGGQGLGLSICRTILDLMGYDYGINNHPDGVEFYFDIFEL